VESFAAAGEALARIRDDELYRETHSTFAAYVRERWNMTRDYAYKSIAAAEVKTSLYTDRIQDQPLPQSEWQARPLAALLAQPEVLREAWQRIKPGTSNSWQHRLVLPV
jgi:hypothetical protein